MKPYEQEVSPSIQAQKGRHNSILTRCGNMYIIAIIFEQYLEIFVEIKMFLFVFVMYYCVFLCTTRVLILIVYQFKTIFFQPAICPLLEAVAEDNNAAAAGDLQVKVNMAVSEDIEIAVVAQPLLLLGEKH